MERIPIWGEKIPYNSTHSKFADMHINFKKKKQIDGYAAIFGQWHLR